MTVNSLRGSTQVLSIKDVSVNELEKEVMKLAQKMINDHSIVNDKSVPPLVDILDKEGEEKILDTLAKRGELNITAIARITGLNHTRTRVNLRELFKKDIIKEKKFGRIKIYEINDN